MPTIELESIGVYNSCAFLIKNLNMANLSQQKETYLLCISSAA